MGTAAVKVIVVDDEPKLRAAWERLLAAEADIELVAALPRADVIAEAVGTHKPDVLLLDLAMPGRDPLEALAELSEGHPEVRAVIYSAQVDDVTVQRAIDAGAWGFVDKLASPQQIIAAIRRVAGGEVVFPSGGMV